MKRISIGERLKEAREENGLSLAEMARKSGMHKTVIWKLENGAHKTAGPDVVENLAKTLRVRPAWLMFGELPKRENPALQKCLDFFDDNTWRPETIAVAKFENLRGDERHQSEWAERLNEIEAALDSVLGKQEAHSSVYQVQNIPQK